jgi:hypothetical protein
VDVNENDALVLYVGVAGAAVICVSGVGIVHVSLAGDASTPAPPFARTSKVWEPPLSPE